MPHQCRRPVSQLPAPAPDAWCALRHRRKPCRKPTPQDLLGVRVDTGVMEGGEIPMYYDSMIAKLIVHGIDRNDAIAKMREASTVL